MTGVENFFKIGTEKRLAAAEIDLEYLGPVELLHETKSLGRGEFVVRRLP
jgi:hypothetical protein